MRLLWNQTKPLRGELPGSFTAIISSDVFNLNSFVPDIAVYQHDKLDSFGRPTVGIFQYQILKRNESIERIQQIKALEFSSISIDTRLLIPVDDTQTSSLITIEALIVRLREDYNHHDALFNVDVAIDFGRSLKDMIVHKRKPESFDMSTFIGRGY